MVVHACNSGIWEAEGGESFQSRNKRPALAIQQDSVSKTNGKEFFKK